MTTLHAAAAAEHTGLQAACRMWQTHPPTAGRYRMHLEERGLHHRDQTPRTDPAVRSPPHAEPSVQPSATGPIRVAVDLNRCQAYAQCCFLAPSVFRLHGEEALWYDPAPDATQ